MFTHVHDTQIQAMNTVVLCSSLCVVYCNTNLPLALAHCELWRNTCLHLQMRNYSFNKVILCKWYLNELVPANEKTNKWEQMSQCSVSWENRQGLISQRHRVTHICTHAHIHWQKRQDYKTTLAPFLLSRGQLPLATHLQKKWGQAPHNWHKPLRYALISLRKFQCIIII